MKLFIRISLLVWVCCSSPVGARDTLASWQDGANSAAIIEFIQSTSTPGNKNFLEQAERVAVFDNDGTLWSEQPIYFQFAYAIDRLKQMAPDHPEWREEEPYKAVLADDKQAIAALDRDALAKIVMVTHTGNTDTEFRNSVGEWIKTARHPRTGLLYTEMVYQPMLEVMSLLRAHGYKTYIVSGGGIEFMRVFAEQVYGVPPEQIIGSSFETHYELLDGQPVLQRSPKFMVLNDRGAKPASISRHIGRRPVIAFGNSDGDFQMLEWTTAARTPSLGVYIHHDDAKREWAYDRDSKVGRLERGLDEAPQRGWLIISMQKDWRVIYSAK